MRKIKCWKHTGHGMVGDASTAIQFSCNDYLCEIAYRMGMGNGEEGRNGTEEREGTGNIRTAWLWASSGNMHRYFA